jgi:hypothetical protein
MPSRNAASKQAVSSSPTTEKKVSTVSNAPAVLFGDVSFEEPAKASITRPKVEVPKEILEVLKKAQALNKRPTWPVRDEVHAAAMADVLYSAGDHLDASILPALGTYVEGKWTRVKDWNDPEVKPTHLRATVGAKRGRKAHPDAKSDVKSED